jgi:hypothetical protein
MPLLRRPKTKLELPFERARRARKRRLLWLVFVVGVLFYGALLLDFTP